MSKSKEHKTKKKSPYDEFVLGIDYGESNIGLALGRAGFSSPIKVINAKPTDDAIQEISKVAHENHVDTIIMGLPLTADRKETQESQKVRHFTKKLKYRINKPVKFVNEYLTSTEALEGAIELGVPQKRRKSIDHISAAVILRKYYDELK